MSTSLDKLQEYMDIYIQLLCNEKLHYTKRGKEHWGQRLRTEDLPTFEYFLDTYNDDRYSLIMPHYKETRNIYDGERFSKTPAQGMGVEDGMATRFYNYWKGVKFYPNNFNGDFSLRCNEINEAIR